MPSALAILSAGSFISRAAAAAAAITPTMPVVCQPPILEALKFARTMRAAISQPMMKAATHSAGVAPVTLGHRQDRGNDRRRPPGR